MNTNEILEAIDQHIAQLQKARALLAEVDADLPAIPATKPSTGKRRGRPKGSVSTKAEVAEPVAIKKAKRTMSAEGKARIAAAQKARWAAQKKASQPTKPVASKTAAKPGKKAPTSVKPVAKKIAAKGSKKAAVPAKKSVAEAVAEA